MLKGQLVPSANKGRSTSVLPTKMAVCPASVWASHSSAPAPITIEMWSVSALLPF